MTTSRISIEQLGTMKIYFEKKEGQWLFKGGFNWCSENCMPGDTLEHVIDELIKSDLGHHARLEIHLWN